MLDREPAILVSIWGPSNAGKTWLVESFHQELQFYNRHDPDFFYELKERGLPVGGAPEHNPTPSPRFRDWEFQRRSKKTTKRHRLSSFSHIIETYDDRGQSLVDMLHNPQVYMTTLSLTVNSSCVIAALDPTLISTFSPHYNNSPQRDNDNQVLQEESFNEDEYAQHLQALCNQIIINKNSVFKDKYLAVCITKLDQLGIRGRKPWQVLRMFFGDKVYGLLGRYQSRINIKVFPTSSVGYHDGDPNVNLTTHEIKFTDSDLWIPHNVAAPFFWLFECLERKSLIERGEKLDLYMSYPGPRR